MKKYGGSVVERVGVETDLTCAYMFSLQEPWLGFSFRRLYYPDSNFLGWNEDLLFKIGKGEKRNKLNIRGEANIDEKKIWTAQQHLENI